jgi:hypothetical protein
MAEPWADIAHVNSGDDTSFPPAGWVTNHEAARQLGVGLATLTCMTYKWRSALRTCARCVRHPVTGGRCNIYSVEGIDQILKSQADAGAAVAARSWIPQGFVDKDGACRMFGVTRHVWKRWIREGKVGFGHVVHSPIGGKQRLYAIEDLQRLKQELFGDDKLYKRGTDGTYHVPAGFIGRQEAWERFGVSMSTWWRWERERKISCGHRVPGGPKLYKIEEIERMLGEYGKWCPPYPDPDRPGVYRVPLSGRDIRRREAIIDADALPLIEGASCSWSTTDKWGFVALTRGEVNGEPLRRIVMGVTEAGLNVRHVNDDPLDCRRANLVVWTVTQRTRNMRKIRAINGRPPTSQYKGVYWETYTKMWRAAIRANGKKMPLGRFGSETAAAEAYDAAARQYFGEHARLNFPDGLDAWLARAA